MHHAINHSYVYRSNFVGTAFAIYDNGDAPRKSKGSSESLRLELGAVLYVRAVSSFVLLSDK